MWIFAVAGSLCLLALEMILGIRIYRDEEASSASIVPLAFQLLEQEQWQLYFPYDLSFQPNIVIAIFLNIILVYIVLKSSSKIEKYLERMGLSDPKTFE
jgi:multiple antibiotic resistance protein